jgi:hypothetical protein
LPARNARAGISTEDAMRAFLGVLAVLVLAPGVQAACVAESGPYTAALVELYTSEGCSSCPPADRWLSRLGSRLPSDRVVPLALHVDYWDYLGWKDPYAQRRFSQRQRRLSLLQRMALVYTPQVVLQGHDFRPWASDAFDEALRRINAEPARARLKVEIRAARPAGLDAAVQAEVSDPARQDAGLYVAAFQSRLQSDVASGENAGRRLAHDYVVLEWQGPFPPGPDGHFAIERRLALLPGATPASSGVAAFVQNRRTAEVLQAVLRSACSP